MLVLLAFAFAAGVWWMRPALTEEEVSQVVVATIQREAPASFFITGTLDIPTIVTVENTKYLLPDLFRFNLGTTRATVRVPGRVSYGFDVGALRPEAIRVGEDGLIEVTLPELSVFSIEPDLERMEVETEVGWARLHASSGQRVEQRAIRQVRRALREQGEQHLARSTQPRIHTAEALEQLLAPVLEAAGLPHPRFRFQIGPELIMESPESGVRSSE